MLPAINQLNKQDNYEKYKTAGDVVAFALDVVVNAVKHNTEISSLCELGDSILTKELSKTYRKKKLEYGKGVCFPTSISINNVVGFYSPIYDSENVSNIIKNGDLVKVEMGAHIDGFPAYVVYTVVVGEASGKKADVIKAVTEASKDILKIMKPGKTNIMVSDIMKEYAKKYNCELLNVSDINKVAPGVISYQMSQNTIDGRNDEDEPEENIHTIILAKESFDYDFGMSEAEFLDNEVYSIDIAMSTGTGKINNMYHEPTLFKRDHKIKYGLKLRTSKQVLSKFNNNYFPVHMRELLKDITIGKVKAGLRECINSGLVIPYSPYSEKSDEYVARLKFTVIVRKKPKLIIGRSMDTQLEKLDLL